ncbi:hypothetical protein HPB52_012070 [Rhipicephalus sanguineus]|uniref:DNA-directed DNA polymerase n=1 Tax=Rhipicephalus sanguineus TaxID=34632 RepID=A0A9D4T3Q3_RHISA|nr:hypothetical protein HPB52_012070 [Rhipicephalus sanguineus]
MPGYPAWYRDFCSKPPAKPEDNPDWAPGPYLISTQMRSVPKLLRLKWDGYPVHYDEKHGWGYLVPNVESDGTKLERIPEEGARELWQKILGEKTDSPRLEENADTDIGIEGCSFFRLPHKDGPHKRVGNPLAKDFLPKITDGTLQS